MEGRLVGESFGLDKKRSRGITEETRFWSASEMKEAARQQGGFFL